jgi:hypothetical protein
MNLKELEKQVTLLEDIQEIENLQKIYGYYFDMSMYNEVVDLFSENTDSVEVSGRGVFRGKEGVKRMYDGMLSTKRPGWVFFEIMQSQGVIDISPDGKTAAGRWYTPSFESRPLGANPRQTWQFGVYENEYIKENNKWYFKKLHWNLTFWTSFEDGFLKVPRLSDELSSFGGADAPPTAYHPYPSGYHVPYHYKHPIASE